MNKYKNMSGARVLGKNEQKSVKGGAVSAICTTHSACDYDSCCDFINGSWGWCQPSGNTNPKIHPSNCYTSVPGHG